MFGLTEALLVSYVLIVVRLTTALVLLPMFGGRGVPPHTKIGLGLFMALVIVPLQGPVELDPGLGPLLVAAGREAIVGAALGVAVMLIFQGLEMAGGLAGLQLGMGLGEVLDPVTGAQSNELRRFYGILATLVFFLANAHHEVIQGLVGSFSVVPVATLTADSLSLPGFVQIGAAMFVIAVRITLPIVAAMFIADMGMAVIARTMPQLNVLVVGLPLKIGLGLLILIAALPATVRIMHFALGGVLDDLTVLLTPAA